MSTEISKLLDQLVEASKAIGYTQCILDYYENKKVSEDDTFTKITIENQKGLVRMYKNRIDDLKSEIRSLSSK